MTRQLLVSLRDHMGEDPSILADGYLVTCCFISYSCLSRQCWPRPRPALRGSVADKNSPRGPARGPSALRDLTQLRPAEIDCPPDRAMGIVYVYPGIGRSWVVGGLRFQGAPPCYILLYPVMVCDCALCRR